MSRPRRRRLSCPVGSLAGSGNVAWPRFASVLDTELCGAASLPDCAGAAGANLQAGAELVVTGACSDDWLTSCSDPYPRSNSSTTRFFRRDVGALLRTRTWPKLCDALADPPSLGFESVSGPCPPGPRRMEWAARSAV